MAMVIMKTILGGGGDDDWQGDFTISFEAVLADDGHQATLLHLLDGYVTVGYPR